MEASISVTKFHGEVIEKVSATSRWLRGNTVMSDGVAKRYSIKIEWSDTLQGFEITETTGK